MSKVAYFDCPTGIAGDMCLGALVDAGVPLTYLVEQLDRLGISDEYTLRAESVRRNGQRATKIYVDVTTDDVTTGDVTTDDATTDNATTDNATTDNATTGDATASDLKHIASSNAGSGKVGGNAHHQITRHLAEIEALIKAASLPPRATQWSLAVFQQLAQAEGAVHGIDPAHVHFHEVGATDAIADIVGTCIGLDWLDIDHLYCSPLPTGGGTVWAAHGRLPVPAPAVLHLLQMGQVPIYSNGIERELVTPTGAAIATTLATAFGPPPDMILQTIGLGAGGHDLDIPNILRLWLGQSTGEHSSSHHSHQSTSLSDRIHRHHSDRDGHTHDHRHHDHRHHDHRHHDHYHHHPVQAHHPSLHHSTTPSPHHPITPSPHHSPPPSPHHSITPSPHHSITPSPHHPITPSLPPSSPTIQTITILETHLDDLNPQIIGYLFDVLLKAGALDVFTQAVGMKKNRPGVLLTVLCLPEQVSVCERIIYRETTTLGIRRREQARSLLHREFQTVSTAYGDIQVKVAALAPGGPVINIKPEYEDCARLAQHHQVALAKIHDSAVEAWLSLDDPT